MKAVVHDTAGPMLKEHSDPVAGAGDAIVSVSRVLLASGDHAGLARRRGFLGIPGSRLVGADLDGRLVAIDPEVPCGRCAHCRGGLAAACPERTTIGARGRDGGLAERIAVPGSNLVAIPASVEPDHATFAGPVGLGSSLARRLRLPEHAFVSVLGDGVASLAAAAALAARHPATRILSDDAFTASVAAKWSLKHRGVSDAGRRHDQEAIAVFSTDPGALAIAAGMLRPRGRIAWCCDGVSPDSEGLDGLRRIEADLLGHSAASVRDGLELLATGTLDPTPLLRRRIGLAEAAIAMTTGRPADLDGTLVVLDEGGGATRRIAAGSASI